MKFEKVKGTRDYYPEEKQIMNKISDLFRQTAKNYGYNEVESPAFEEFKLLAEKEGSEIREQIFTLEKRSNETLGLRFDLTVPLTRMFIARQKELPKPVKWFYISRMWRYEAPQKGRLREFYQYGVELFGSDKQEADAEIIRVAIESLEASGLTSKDIVVKINNRNLTEGLLQEYDVGDGDALLRIIDKKSKIGRDEFVSELKKLKLGKEEIDELIEVIETNDIEKLEVINDKAKKALEDLKRVLELLEDKKDFIRVDLATVRGLAYYTGTVFEIYDREEKLRAICGGGRYDNLVQLFSGEKCPATGFAIGFATLEILLDEKMLLPDLGLKLDYYIAPVNPSLSKKANDIASQLRKKGFSAEVDVMQRGLSKQLDYASSIKAEKVIIVGDKDLANKEVTLRDMVSGKEKKVKIDKL